MNLEEPHLLMVCWLLALGRHPVGTPLLEGASLSPPPKLLILHLPTGAAVVALTRV